MSRLIWVKAEACLRPMLKAGESIGGLAVYRNILVPVDLSHEDVTRRILELGKRLCSEGVR